MDKTICLDESVHRKLKAESERLGISMRVLVNEAILDIFGDSTDCRRRLADFIIAYRKRTEPHRDYMDAFEKNLGVPWWDNEMRHLEIKLGLREKTSD